MSLRRNPCSFAAVLMSASLLAGIGPADAQRNTRPASLPYHDGIYAIHIVTDRGGCDKSYIWTIAIAGGRISSTGGTPMEATGQIDPRGVVSLAFRLFNEVAYVAGRVKGKKGSGTWSSPTMACAGTWRAVLRS